MLAVLVELQAPYGVASYLPQASTSPPHYSLPPPTTLVGALAYPYLRGRVWSELDIVGGTQYSPARRLLEKVKYASAGAKGVVQVRDVERVFQAVYLRKEHRAKAEQLFTVGVRGASYFLDDSLYVFYVVTDAELAKYAYGIVRLGRKEGLVSVRRVVTEELSRAVKSVGRGSFETIFYYPTRIAAKCPEDEGSAKVVPMPRLSERNFAYTLAPEVEEYCVPVGVGKVWSELKNSGALISIDGLEIPVPRDALGL